MSESEDNTRPVSVAELLARNGTIGAPPMGGHRRRRRRNAVSVAELTGEIPVYQTGEMPVVDDDDLAELGEPYESDDSAEPAELIEQPADTALDATPDASPIVEYPATEVVYASAATDYYAATDYQQTDAPAAEPVHPAAPEAATEAVPVERARPAGVRPPRSRIPLPTRRRGPERSYDPRPRRRSTEAEQMAYDPVDDPARLTDVADTPAPEPEDRRPAWPVSTSTLFSGETVADDLARRGLTDADEDDEQFLRSPARVEDQGQTGVEARVDAEPDDEDRGLFGKVWGSVVAIGQSLLAVLFGAGLFIAFDQLWRWNNIVALALSTLVIVALVVGVHVVRKTEDFISILIAVAVGILITFGPLALQST